MTAPTVQTDVLACIRTLEELPADIDETTKTVGDSLDDAVLLLAALRDVRADLAACATTLESQVVEMMGGRKRAVVGGLGEIEVLRRTRRTGWRHDELIPTIVARIMDERETLYDPETGELLPYAAIGHNVAGRLRECVSFGAGKVTGLRAMGLQADEWCSEEADGASVKLPPRPVA